MYVGMGIYMLNKKIITQNLSKNLKKLDFNKILKKD